MVAADLASSCLEQAGTESRACFTGHEISTSPILVARCESVGFLSFRRGEGQARTFQPGFARRIVVQGSPIAARSAKEFIATAIAAILVSRAAARPSIPGLAAERSHTLKDRTARTVELYLS